MKAAPFDGFPRSPGSAVAEIRSAVDRGIALGRCNVGQRWGAEVELMVDCHSFFDVPLAQSVARRLEPQHLTRFAERSRRGRTAETLAEIRRSIRQPLAGGEMLFGAKGFAPLCRSHAVHVIMPDVKHCGGLLEMTRIAAMAHAAGVAVAPHNPSGPVATAASVQICAGMVNFRLLELQWGEIGWRSDLIRMCDSRSMGRPWPALLLAVIPCAAADLPHAIDALMDASPVARASVGIQVVDLKTGTALYSRNADRLFLPASNMKLFTAALALERLGPEYRMTTRLVRAPSGDLILVGGGDPSMSGRTYPYPKDARATNPLQAIEDLADQAVAAGILRVDGDIVGDDQLYPWAPYPPSWTVDDVTQEDGAPVSALTVNDNAITLAIHPAARAGDLAAISLEPAIEYYAVDNRVLTVAGEKEARIRLTRKPGSRQLLVWGPFRWPVRPPAKRWPWTIRHCSRHAPCTTLWRAAAWRSGGVRWPGTARCLKIHGRSKAT